MNKTKDNCKGLCGVVKEKHIEHAITLTSYRHVKDDLKFWIEYGDDHRKLEIIAKE